MWDGLLTEEIKDRLKSLQCIFHLTVAPDFKSIFTDGLMKINEVLSIPAKLEYESNKNRILQIKDKNINEANFQTCINSLKLVTI